jgi:hypothetical protein
LGEEYGDEVAERVDACGDDVDDEMVWGAISWHAGVPGFAQGAAGKELEEKEGEVECYVKKDE